MRIGIIYDTHTGTTAGAAEKMAEVVRAAGHECNVANISNADSALNGAKAVVLGAWTQGWFIIRQHPSEPMMRCVPSSVAFRWARTMPWTPSLSVMAMDLRPRRCASSTSSSGWLAPSRKEKLVLHHRGA